MSVGYRLVLEEVLLGRLAGSWRAPSLCVHSTLPERYEEIRYDEIRSLKKEKGQIPIFIWFILGLHDGGHISCH